MKKQKEIYSYMGTSEKNEIDDIVNRYMEKSPAVSAADEIKKLDNTVEHKSGTAAIVVGIIGSLILGAGMCCVMVWQGLFTVGIIVGIIGIAVLACAYPVYKKISARERRKISARIINLSKQVKSENA